MLLNKKIDITIAAIVLLISFALVIWSVLPVQAQQPACNTVEGGIKSLSRDYGETAIFRGLSSSGYIIMIFLNQETGTWTVGKISPEDRRSLCPLDGGENGQLSSEVVNKGQSAKKPKL